MGFRIRIHPFIAVRRILAILTLSGAITLILGVAQSAMAQPCLPPDDEIARWSGDDDDDGVGSNDLTLVDDATAGVATGIGGSGSAFHFDGSGDYATTGTMTLPSAGTFVLWVRPSALATGLNALAGTHGSDIVRRLQVSYTGSAGRSGVDPYDTVGLFGTSPLTRVNGDSEGRFRVGEWTMVAVTWDYPNGDDFAVFVDGQLVGTTSDTPSTPTQEFLFGAELYSGGYAIYNDYFNGDIDEVRVFDYVLSSCEIPTLYDSEKPDSDADAVANKDDNCMDTANGPGNSPSNQIDADQDGYGNACDADYDQNGTTTVGDFGTFSSCLTLSNGSNFPPVSSGGPANDPTCEESDHNQSGAVTVGGDYGIFLHHYGPPSLPPGPSGLSCANLSNIPCP